MSEQYNYDFPKTQDQLNQLVADISQLEVNVHQTHWYLRGKNFFTLHPLMDTYRDQLDDYLDQIAERLIAINGSPVATMQEFRKLTTLPDEVITWNQYSESDLIQRLIDQYRYLKDHVEAGIEISDAEKDYPTQDILNGFKRDIDKNIWMLSAEVNKGPYDAD